MWTIRATMTGVLLFIYVFSENRQNGYYSRRRSPWPRANRVQRRSNIAMAIPVRDVRENVCPSRGRIENERDRSSDRLRRVYGSAWRLRRRPRRADVTGWNVSYPNRRGLPEARPRHTAGNPRPPDRRRRQPNGPGFFQPIAADRSPAPLPAPPTRPPPRYHPSGSGRIVRRIFSFSSVSAADSHNGPFTRSCVFFPIEHIFPVFFSNYIAITMPTYVRVRTGYRLRFARRTNHFRHAEPTSYPKQRRKTRCFFFVFSFSFSDFLLAKLLNSTVFDRGDF